MLDKAHQGMTSLALSGTAELAIGAVIAGAVTYIWYRFRRTEERLEKTMSKDEVTNLIDLKVTPLQVEQINIKKDIEDLSAKLDKNQDRIDIKLDKIIDRLID